MRISQNEIKNIREAAKVCFGETAKVYLFGSRVLDHTKGGDIDLYIQPGNGEHLFNKKIQMLTMLYQSIGEQKIDIVIQNPEHKRLIDEIALKEGVLL